MAINEEIELKVGLFLLIGVLILVAIIFSIGDIQIFQKGYTVKLRFNDVGGLKEGAPVNLLGVEIGEVESVNFVYDEQNKHVQIELLLWLKEGAKVGKNATAMIKRFGLMGEQYIDLTLGDAEENPLKDGDIFYGKTPLTMEDVSQQIYEASTEFKKAVANMNEVLEDADVKTDLKTSINNIEEATESLRVILNRIENKEGTIGLLISEDEVYRDIETTVKDIKRHPWKLLFRTRDKDEKEEEEEKKGYIIQKGPGASE
jgi:phospholipid/cholesterol/gamma-HCH transport system substrate-binding protein